MTTTTRFTRTHPCPICGGHDGEHRGRGERCYGYLDSTGSYARCTREELAGDLEQNDDATYSHRLEGPCRCGAEHGPAPTRSAAGGNGSMPYVYPSLEAVINGYQRKLFVRHVATYEYRDEDNELLFVVLRFDPKTFRQARPVPGGWSTSLGEVRRPLYRTPDLAGAGNRWVIVPEGEKDVDRLYDLGLIATTSPGGAPQEGAAAKWRQEHSDQLRGHSVCFIADRDDAGRHHVQQAAAMTYPLAAEVKLIELDAKDASDWLDEGHDVEELKRRILEAPRWEPPATDDTASAEPYALPIREFAARKLEANPPLVGTDDDILLPIGGLLILFAKGGKGKTTMSVDAALCLASGVPWLNFPVPRPLRILFIENEGPQEPFRRKIERKLASWHHEIIGEVFVKTANWGAFVVNQQGEQVALRRFIDEQQIDLVIGDPLDSMGVKGVGSPEDTRDFLAGLVAVGLTRDLAFWLLHHANKAEWDDELDEISGAWGGKPDTMLKLAKEPGNRARLSFPKIRWGANEQPAYFLAFDPDTEAFSVAGVEQTEERDLLQDIRDHLADGRLRTAKEIASKKDGGIGASEPRVKDVLEGHPDVFLGLNGAVVGRSARATVWRLRTTQDTGL